ncbi:MAG TPA: hypothetical protein VFU99_01540 [Gaiellaceae bacterium]|nr:hypothetical protein [Gaiellaceae bacterium]
MQAAEQWAQIQATLDPMWSEAQLAFAPEGSPAEAAAVLGPLQPVLIGDELRFHILRRDAGAERTRNTLRQLDRKRIWGTLALLDVAAEAPVTPAAAASTARPHSLVEAWDEAIAELPPDWSDVLCELELDSSDHLPRAALLGAPLNPSRVPGELALRFRASGKQGYGVSPQMARRCFERMDAESITGRITVMVGLSDTENDHTQGPVWRLAGRSV